MTGVRFETGGDPDILKLVCQEIARYGTSVRCFRRITRVEAVFFKALREHLAMLGVLVARQPAAARKAMQYRVDARLHSVVALVFDQTDEFVHRSQTIPVAPIAP